MTERKQFTFYRSFATAARGLKRNDRLSFLDAIIDYALYGTEPEGINPVPESLFALCKPTLDASRRKAEAGMAPKTKRNQNENTAQTEKKHSANEKEYEVENEIENEFEAETDCSQDESAFAAFWSVYPCQLEKDSAFSAWKTLRPDAKTVQCIMKALSGWKKCDQWNADGGRYVPRAAKWLLQGHWKQIPKPGGCKATAMGATGQLGEAELEAIRSALAE